MINYYSNKEDFQLDDKDIYNNWIKRTIELEGEKTGDIQYIFCDDEYLLDINKRFLNHDYYTDIVTFSMSSNEKVVNGEIYISVDRVKDNAGINKVSFDEELSRVIIHGVLHLLGYDDQTEEEKHLMRKKEDYYLNLLRSEGGL